MSKSEGPAADAQGNSRFTNICSVLVFLITLGFGGFLAFNGWQKGAWSEIGIGGMLLAFSFLILAIIIAGKRRRAQPNEGGRR
jgi:hypothetical protein